MGWVLGFPSKEERYFPVQCWIHFYWLMLVSFSGKEHALLISNHRSDIDWLVGWVLAQVHTAIFCNLPMHMYICSLSLSLTHTHTHTHTHTCKHALTHLYICISSNAHKYFFDINTCSNAYNIKFLGFWFDIGDFDVIFSVLCFPLLIDIGSTDDSDQVALAAH